MTALLANPDVVVSFIGGVFALITATFTELLRRQHNALKSVKATTEAAAEQVQNDHKTNLRDDIDRVIGLAESLVEGHARQERALERHGEELNNLRTDVAWERRERMDLAARLTRHLGDS